MVRCNDIIIVDITLNHTPKSHPQTQDSKDKLRYKREVDLVKSISWHSGRLLRGTSPRMAEFTLNNFDF